MKPDRSWSALLRPGEATDFFLTESPLPAFTVTPDYRVENALICSELSRLVYCDDAGTRRESLRRANLYEVKFFSKAYTQAMLVEGEDFHVLAFRGTSEGWDWLTNSKALPVAWSTGGKIHQGFGKALLRVWPKIESWLAKLKGPVYLCGHSLGGALSIAAGTLYRPKAICTYGQPMTGDRVFLEALTGVPVYRIVNGQDIVPRVPFGLKHAGQLRILRDDDAGQPRVWTARRLDAYPRSLPPPEFLSAHAPIQYSCALERLL